eukprot:13555151-Alexandrium_andersonii.AAC.1
MSASLVGSEMCIRDRGSSPHSQPARGETSPRRACPVGRSPHRASEVWGRCLLYTSDAADDM